MNADTREQAEIETPPPVKAAAPMVPPMGVFPSMTGFESNPTWLGWVFDFLKSLDYATLVTVLTAVGVTAMGLTPVLVARDVTTAGAVVSCTGIVVLGAVGFTAILISKRDGRGTTSKDDPNQPANT
jgi:hypothetical protein